MPTIQEALIQSVQEALQIPTFDVIWEKRKSLYRDDTAHVSIAPLSIRKQGGWDEIRYSEDGDGFLQERLYGVRQFRFQVTVYTDNQNFEDFDTGFGSAIDLADRIRTGLDRSDIAALFDSADIALATTTDVRDVSTWDAHGDERSVAVFELTFNAHRTIFGPQVVPVEAVEYHGVIQDEAGDTAAELGPTMVGEPYGGA